MIIYNKTWLNNLAVHHQYETQHNAGCITNDELKTIKEQHPIGFYTPGIIIRVGMFILTCITTLFSFGLLSLMMSTTHIVEHFGWALFLGVVTAAILEIITKEKNYYQAGINDALMWMAAIFIAGALWWMLEPQGYGNGHADKILVSFVILAVSLVAVLRYADMLMAAISTLAFFAFIFFLWTRFGFMGIATIPFILMIVTGLGYTLLSSIKQKIKVTYYNNCIIMAQVVSLVILYAAGNYFITDRANHVLNNIPQTTKLAVMWAPFFWAWTMLVPLVYIGLGIRNKNVISLRVGLVLMAAGIYTFRTYYHIMSIELALIIAGVALLALVYLIVRYLKTPKHGFTYADIDNGDKANNINIEGLITVATFKQPHTHTGPENKFGGGDFGGSGSGGKF
ncbi:MAG: hypothetical protein V4619_04120 [Bacteroidota bacterium]